MSELTLGGTHTQHNEFTGVEVSLEMAAFSPFSSYILGTACFARGLMTIFSPEKEYNNIGLPFDIQDEGPSPTDQYDVSGISFTSPLMYFKGIREISYGLTLVALEWQGNAAAVTTFAAVLSLVRFGDGLVVWLNGGEKLKFKAMGHWITGVSFLGWVIRRWR
ncbi:hypothetical protein F4813DRAFT_387687 [Daldinia decipiens]|uniref:uncharacterized protein n=1 Tax=Daldinia decipiens TaxID=326647 RepID=UPI0020C26895|nr:uncharacterized protein F4813DRAFT_387687 [Daldinia decipiens]KAI1659580.1 hypothetical protein F4813DRAFT_387687 [Daldinia decipiens]